MSESFENLEGLKAQYQVPQTFNINGVTYAKITDSNMGVYSSGQLRYNVQSLYAGSASEKPVYELAEAYIQLYLTNTLKLTDATFIDASLPSSANGLQLPSRQNIFKVHNKSGLAVKDPIALVNQYWFSMANQDVITSPTHSYFYNLIKLRTENKEDLEKKMAVVDRVLDNGLSMIRDPLVGEINNINSEEVAKDVYGLDECNTKNELYGRKFVPYGSGSVPVLLEASTFTETDLQNLEIPYMKWNSANEIVYYDIVKIYLKDIDSFFANCPSLMQIPKFNLTINSNISDNSTWKVTYDNSTYSTKVTSSPLYDIVAPGTAGQLSTAEAYKYIQTGFKHYFKPSKVEVTSGNSTCCPFLLADAGLSRNNNLRNGLVIQPDDGKANPTLTISSKIGWGNIKNQTYLYIPQIVWNPEIASSIIPEAPHKFYVNKAIVDMNTFANLSFKTPNIKKPLNNSFSRVRNIYLVPYTTAFGLSDGDPAATPSTLVQTGVRPYESPLSSAPVTNSNVYLSRINIWMGGKALLPNEDNYSPIHLYDNQLYRVLDEKGGNNSLGVPSGMVSKNDWRGAYHYYKFDMSKYNADAVADNLPKSFEIGFDIVSNAPPSNAKDPNKPSLDVIVIVEYEVEYNINRFQGTFV